jgi:hypothetical protein
MHVNEKKICLMFLIKLGPKLSCSEKAIKKKIEINYNPFCKKLKINFRGHLSQSDERAMHAGMRQGIYGSRLMKILIEINVLQFSHDMGEANESKGYMR